MTLGGTAEILKKYAGNMRLLLLCISAVVVMAMPSAFAHALSLNNSQYVDDEVVLATCDEADATMELYDITPDENGQVLDRLTMGNYPCGTPASITFDSQLGHTYALLEIRETEYCYDKYYHDCREQLFLIDEDSFVIGNTSIPSSGEGAAPTLRVSQSTYAPGQTVIATCIQGSDSLELYDVTLDSEGLTADRLSLGNFPCGSSIVFEGELDHRYALIEIRPGEYCSDKYYDDCRVQSFVRGEVSFLVGLLGDQRTSYAPVVVITNPKSTTFFSRELSITYSATDENNNTGYETPFVMGPNPVAIYMIDSMTDKFYGTVPSSYKTLLAKDQPAQGTFKWDVSTLLPGVPYRIVIDAADNSGVFGQAVSEIFYVDFSLPEFTVSVEPSATRGAPVKIIVDSSEDLKAPPKVVVSQEGYSGPAVVMKGEGSHFEGSYTPISGHDGIAKISVTGTDLGGNEGSLIVSGGTFAVGVNPPPAPKITFPRNNDITGVGTTTLTGTTRADTSIILTVNGTDTYTATPDASGSFTIPNIRLSKDKNRGINTLSMVTKDSLGITSSAATIRVRYNVAPTISFSLPRADATISGTSILAATSTDENGDLLTYTYQIISASEFDFKASATSSVNEWITISESDGSKYSWDTTEVEDGAYYGRIIVSDGAERAYSNASRFSVRNTLPFFRFADGRRTVSRGGTVTVSGRAIAPSLSPRPTIARVEYSTDSGKTWKIAALTGAGSTEASFSVAFPQQGEGTYPILWRARDSRNLIGRATHLIVFDATPPQAPRITSPRASTVISSEQDEDRFQAGIQVTLTGTAEPQSIVTLRVATSTRTATASLDGSFFFKNVTLTHGVNTFELSATDTAGNQSTTSAATVIQDDAPEIVILEPKSEHGLTGNARISWRVRDPEGDPVSVSLQYRRGNGALTQLPVAAGASSFEWDLRGFPEGNNYELIFTARDGFATSTETIGFSIDSTAPTLRSFDLVADRIGAKGLFKASGEAEDALSGIAYVEYAIREKGTPPENTEWLLSTITKGFLSSRASYAISRETRLDDGTFEVVARAVDAAGNVSPVLTREIIVDTSPPHIGSFGIVEGSVRISPDTEGKLETYANHAAQFAISLEGDTERAELFLGDSSVPLTRDIASGLWQASLPPTGEERPLSVTAADLLGNVTEKKSIGMLSPIERGSVRDQSGAALAQVPLEVLVYDESRSAFVPSGTTVNTAADGSYELVLAPGQYELRARLAGHRPGVQQLSLDRPAFVSTSFTLEPYTGIRGFFERIVDYWRDQ